MIACFVPINFLYKSTFKEVIGVDNIYFIDWNDFTVVYESGKVNLYRKDQLLTGITCFYLYDSRVNILVIEALSRVLNIPVIPDIKGIRNSSNKEITNILLGSYGYRMPESIYYNSNTPDKLLYSTFKDDSCLFKPIKGSLGKGIVLGESKTGINLLRQQLKENYFAQNVIYNPGKQEDERYIVVNGKIVSCFRRVVGVDNELRANLACGSKAEKLNPDKTTTDIVLNACSCINLDVAGVDIKRDNNKTPYILELNPYPSVSCVNAGGYNYFKDIAEYIKNKK